MIRYSGSRLKPSTGLPEPGAMEFLEILTLRGRQREARRTDMRRIL